MRIGIVSTAGFCTPLLQMLAQNNIPVSVFADAGTDPAGDLPMVAAFCSRFKIPLQTGAPDMLYFWLEELKSDIVFVMGYRHLIDVKQLPPVTRNNIYNIHFGPLPGYKGPNPVFWQIKNGEKQLTATIHRLDERFDHGAVVWAKSVSRELYMNYGIAHTILAQVIIEGVGFIIRQTITKSPLPAAPQNNTASRYYKRPVLQDVSINWQTMTAAEIVNLILACNPWNKGAMTTFNGQEVKLLDGEIAGASSDDSILPGTITGNDNGLKIYCQDKNILKVTMLCIEGSFIPARNASFFGLVPLQQMR